MDQGDQIIPSIELRLSQNTTRLHCKFTIIKFSGFLNPVHWISRWFWAFDNTLMIVPTWSPCQRHSEWFNWFFVPPFIHAKRPPDYLTKSLCLWHTGIWSLKSLKSFMEKIFDFQETVDLNSQLSFSNSLQSWRPQDNCFKWKLRTTQVIISHSIRLFTKSFTRRVENLFTVLGDFCNQCQLNSPLLFWPPLLIARPQNTSASNGNEDIRTYVCQEWLLMYRGRKSSGKNAKKLDKQISEAQKHIIVIYLFSLFELWCAT